MGHYIEILRSTDELNVRATLNDLDANFFNVSVFVIDNGLPVNRTAITPRTLSAINIQTVEGSGES